MFPEKHTIYAVVSLSSLLTDFKPVPKVEGYFMNEHGAKVEAERQSTWKSITIMAYEVTIADLVRTLNRQLETQNG